MKFLLSIVSLLFLVFLVWQLWYVFLINLKEPTYTVLEKRDGYEIRKYDSYLTAHVTFSGAYKTAVNKGFRILARYIFGENKQNIKMPMTAPVFIEEKRKMNCYDISFVMPASYKKETLPKPKDARIGIIEKKAAKVAVYRFTWYPSAALVEQKKKEFIELLKRDDIMKYSDIILARYNPPFILPFLMHNELLVVIDE